MIACNVQTSQIRIPCISDQEATPSAWSNTKPSNDDQIRTPQHIQIHTPGSIGPRTPLTSQLSQTRKPPFPTDISQLGPPPSDVKSFAPPFSRNPVKIFGKLMITIMRGKNLKAGQGTFGRANPFVKIKMGQIVVTTEPHVEGGKNPVSIYNAYIVYKVFKVIPIF